ncbi:type I restriction-modification enzyme R subunit C-terminal domain-containing protein [Streptomyces sp. SM1]|uniref:type I restriction-modification enzyme R subunit C-terminal domain-containing protein n=1 Tax=Streptomyces sp. SM1 TaxID=402229 RepID=UPI0021565426|nr:type I restriction-modification enzyme R subunit C-terminal domain-containing protein [Streptomyces sp. SM1]
MDRQAAQKAFEVFCTGKQLSARQLDFLTLIIDTVVRRGILSLGDLYEDAFSDLAPGGPDDLFTGDELERIKVIFKELERRAQPTTLAA